MNTNTLPGEPVAWHSIFCPRPAEMAALQAAYERAADSRSPRPGIVVLLSESGLGKTRLVQEFFHWLSTTKDGVGDAGYWPDVLARQGDNLRIDPEPAACNHAMPLPFMWWGVRLADSGRHNEIVSLSVLASSADSFEPHLEPMLQARRRAERDAEFGRSLRDLAIESGTEIAGNLLIPWLGAIKAAGTFAYKAVQLTRGQQDDDGTRRSPAELEESQRRNLADEYIARFHALLDARQGFGRPVPFVFAIDDAQWAKEDPALLDLLDRLLPAARDRHWPMLLVVTHWQAEWNAGSAMRQIVERHAEPAWRPLPLSPHPDLSACIAAAFPGLTPEQAELILAKAGGNPRLLDEILRWLAAHPRFFVDRDRAQAMTVASQIAVDNEVLDLHRLVERRLDAAPPDVKATLAVSGLQGMRFLTAEVFKALHQAYPVREAVARAENPHSFVVRYRRRCGRILPAGVPRRRGCRPA